MADYTDFILDATVKSTSAAMAWLVSDANSIRMIGKPGRRGSPFA